MARGCRSSATPVSCPGSFQALFRRIHSMTIQKVGVVGCGLMGSGIAQVSAQAGFPTVVREVSKELLDKGLGAVFKFMQGGVEKGKVSQFDLDKVKENLKGTVELEGPRRLRSRGRGDHREHRRQEGDLRHARRPVQARDDLRVEHLEPLDHRAVDVREAPAAHDRPALLQSRAADEAGRGGAHGAHWIPRQSRRPTRGARRSARPRSTAATRPASW